MADDVSQQLSPKPSLDDPVRTGGATDDGPARSGRVLVILNSHSGTLAHSDSQDEPQRIAALFLKFGIDADVRVIDLKDLPSVVDGARVDGTTAVIVGGGDGTVNAVANAVADTRLLFGVLPLGTHNHFAKEIGAPLELSAAIEQLSQSVRMGRIEAMDIAEVNGRAFLNFSGIGLHPTVVERREREHEQLKRHSLLKKVLKRSIKPIALLVAFVRSLPDLPILRVYLQRDAAPQFRRTTPALLVVTNVHQMEIFGVKKVSVPRRNVLNIYIARSKSLSGIVRLVLAALTRRLAAMREFESLSADELTLAMYRQSIKVTLDGEVVRMQTPLRYRFRRSALRVLMPAGSTAAAQSVGRG